MEQFVYIQCHDHKIPMELFIPEIEGKFPCVLLLHGFLSSRNGDGFLLKRIGEFLLKEGIASARIDFASMGENTYSREYYGMKTMLEEVKVSFSYLQQLDCIDKNHIGILGHSLGGRVTLLSQDLPSSILVTLNGDIRKESSVFIELHSDSMVYPTTDGRNEKIYKRFFDELKQFPLSVHYKNPILVCVGTKDPTLNPDISYEFIQRGLKNVDSILIEGANHTFHAKTLDYTLLDQLISKLVPWIKNNI